MIRISQILRSAHDVLDFLSSEDTIQKSMDKITEQLPWVPEVLVAKPRRRVASRESRSGQALLARRLLVAGEREDLRHPGY